MQALQEKEANLLSELEAVRKQINDMSTEDQTPTLTPTPVTTVETEEVQQDTEEQVEEPEDAEKDWEGDVDAKVAKWKELGNKAFAANEFDAAVKYYTRCINGLKKSDRAPIAAILGNRSAAYIGLKRFVPASWDAQCAAEADPLWWKAYWRHGVSLMSMAPRMERSQTAVTAFEKCRDCEGLPANKKEDVAVALERAKIRLQEGKDKTPMPAQCAPS